MIIGEMTCIMCGHRFEREMLDREDPEEHDVRGVPIRCYPGGCRVDKKRERACLDAVFGEMRLRVAEGEEPDFVCGVSNGFEFGVEVTEFFRTGSDARLARIERYAADLLAGGDYHHKDDRNEIPVRDVTYRRQETGEEIQLKAIPRDVPSHRVTAPQLLQQIKSKNAKYSRYAKRCTPVDLIVDDVDQILRFESIRQLLTPMLDKGELRTSPFREIYVLTLSTEKGAVAVPIRANLFASEIAIFNMVYNEFRKHDVVEDTIGKFLTLLAVNLVERLPDVRYDVVEGVPRYIFASVAWTLDDQHTVEIVDVSREPCRDAKPLSAEVERDRLPAALRKLLEKTRESQFVAYELYFPIVQKSGE